MAPRPPSPSPEAFTPIRLACFFPSSQGLASPPACVPPTPHLPHPVPRSPLCCEPLPVLPHSSPLPLSTPPPFPSSPPPPTAPLPPPTAPLPRHPAPSPQLPHPPRWASSFTVDSLKAGLLSWLLPQSPDQLLTPGRPRGAERVSPGSPPSCRQQCPGSPAGGDALAGCLERVVWTAGPVCLQAVAVFGSTNSYLICFPAPPWAASPAAWAPAPSREAGQGVSPQTGPRTGEHPENSPSSDRCAPPPPGPKAPASRRWVRRGLGRTQDPCPPSGHLGQGPLVRKEPVWCGGLEPPPTGRFPRGRSGGASGVGTPQNLVWGRSGDPSGSTGLPSLPD